MDTIEIGEAVTTDMAQSRGYCVPQEGDHVAHDGVLHVGDANDNGEHLAGITYEDSTVTSEERAIDPTWNPEQALRVDVEEYNRWATGEVYGYIVERQIPACDHCGCEARWEQEESVWGHIGTDYAEQSAKEALQSYL